MDEEKHLRFEIFNVWRPADSRARLGRERRRTCRYVAQWLICSLLILLLTLPAVAVLSGYDSENGALNDPDYAAGLAAWQEEDWQAVITHMTRVLERKPWHDQAHNLMGFAYRKLGDYPHSLTHYQQALDLNPHHQGALAYLGQTYLAMGCKTHAVKTLHRLATACKRVMPTETDCEAWRDLQTAIESYRLSTKSAGCDPLP
jgi:tetratricopeptide (TPR) repeat protein